MSKDKTKVSRTHAHQLITEVRRIAGPASPSRSGRTAEDILRELKEALERAGLEPDVLCTGDAHTNAHIDNCMSCKNTGQLNDEFRIT